MASMSTSIVERCLAIVAVIAGVACSRERPSAYLGDVEPGPSDLATLTIALASEPGHLDPALAGDNLSQTLVHALFEGLTVPHPRDLHPVQGVAERYERSDDGRLYRFHLRREARWSDGRAVTSRDFLHAWRRLVRPETGSESASDLYPVKNAERIHGGRLRVARRALAVRPLSAATGAARLAEGEAVVVLARTKDGATVARFGGGASEGDAPPLGLVDEEDLGPGDALLGVRAPSDLVFDVELERPTPYFIDLTARATLVPVRQDVVEAAAARGAPERWTRPENLVNNGPFRLESWTFRYALEMTPNPHYWNGGSVQLRRVIWREVESSHTAMNLYKVGALDAFGSGSSIPSEYRPLLADKRDVVRFPLLATYWLEHNTRAPPLDDVRVRRALGLAVDKRALVERVTGGAEIPATHYVPEITGGGYAEAWAADRAAGIDPFAAEAYAPDRARALFEEAGYPIDMEGGGRRAQRFPGLEILYNAGDDGNRAIAVAIQDMWRRELGFTATLRCEDWKAMLESVRAGRFQVVRGLWIADYNHPHTFLETFRAESPQNPTGWSNPELDDLLVRAAGTTRPRESIQQYREAERIAVRGAARTPLFFAAGATLVKPWVKGFQGNGQALDLVRWIWMDPAWRGRGNHELTAAPRELEPPGGLELR